MTTHAPTMPKYRADLSAQGYSPRTVRMKVWTVTSCAAVSGVDPADLTREHVLAWLGMADRASWTRLKYLQHLKAWAFYAGIADPTEGIRRPPHPRGVPRPVSEADLRRLLLAARPGRERAWIVLGAFAGLRSFESAKVRAEDLEDAPGGGYLLRIVGKGDQLAVVPLPEVVVDELRAAAALVGRRGRLWPTATGHSVQRAVRRVAARAGVFVTSHQLRHRYGTAIYAVSKDLLLTQQVMRHASPSTTAGYAQVAANQAAGIVSRIPGATRNPMKGLG